MRSRLSITVVVVVAAAAGLSLVAWSWLPLVFSLPWLVPIVWFARRDTGQMAEFSSSAEAARERLWTAR
jgi:hypothetical protein